MYALSSKTVISYSDPEHCTVITWLWCVGWISLHLEGHNFMGAIGYRIHLPIIAIQAIQSSIPGHDYTSKICKNRRCNLGMTLDDTSSTPQHAAPRQALPRTAKPTTTPHIYGPASLGTPPHPHPMVMGLYSSAPVPPPPLWCGWWWVVVGGGGWWWWKKLYMYVYVCICIWLYDMYMIICICICMCMYVYVYVYMNMYIMYMYVDMLLRSSTY